MIVADRLVFLHLHKSGGTFVNEFLLRFVRGARRVGYHLPRNLVPPACAQLPVLGFVRNPWDYYVSWYAFQAALPSPNVLFRTLSEEGRLDFERTIVNMLELDASARHLDRLVAALPAGYGPQGLNVPGFVLESIRASGRGFYSFLYAYLYAGAGSTLIGRTDRLRAELPTMLGRVGEPLTPAMQEYLAAAPDSNTSVHSAYVKYYGTELRDLVAVRDAPVIAAHGFEF